ncbi:MAG: DNA-binding CsgD family transcriptional regulator [Arenicella sp.]|jgi:DNA-binding CsgD family transcriptional regulator
MLMRYWLSRQVLSRSGESSAWLMARTLRLAPLGLILICVNRENKVTESQAAHPLSQAIYEGVLESPPWATLLKALESYMQVPSATIVLRRPRFSDPGYTVYLYSESDGGALEEFTNEAYRDSPFAQLPEEKVFTLQDRVAHSELSTVQFSAFLAAYDVSDLIGFDVFDRATGIRLRLRLVRTGSAPAFSQKDRDRLASMIPLMNQALKLYSAYTRNSFIEGFYKELLGSMGIASIILNAELEVLSSNKAAKQILKAKDGLFVLGNALRCSESSDQRKMLNVCQALAGSARSKTPTQQSQSTSIARKGSEAKWDVHIRIIKEKKVSFGGRGPILVLLLQGRGNAVAPSPARLIEKFGVTPAEAKLIPLLVEGLTLTAAAKALGVSRNTARAQLSSIFVKTGVNRQTQLVKLVSDAFATHWQ